jgi:DNA-binding beta-propeller fold protein YncE
MKRMPRIVVIALACLAVAASPSNGPIALDWHKGGHLYVLLKNSSVSILDEITKRKLTTIPARFGAVPVEVFSTRLKEGEHVFISGFWGRSGTVWQYTAEGAPYARFETPEQGASFDVDPKGRVLYVASPVTNVVYAMSLDQKGSAAKRVAYIREAEALGPVIFDQGRNRLMLGDTAGGTLYEVNVANGSYQQIAANLGRPISLGIDATSKTLFLADSLTSRVYVFHLENGVLKLAEAIPTGLRTLSAVTLGPGDTVFVADGYNVYQLSLKTKKLTRFKH